MIAFFIQGKPVAKERPRFGKDAHGRPRTYTPEATKTWEEQIAWESRMAISLLARAGGGGPEVSFPFERRVISELTFYLPRPKSYPKSMTVMLKKPDLDNLSKAVLDGLAKGRILKDDNIVTDEINRKRYAEAESMPMGVLVELTGWL